MIHLGDITQIHGDEIPVVDIITGGSPCQDLSVAGKRAGLDGERSGLFMEQIRIVKEMRERDRRTGRTGWLVRPRFMVWENVPGAFSSNKGKDFQAVLTEIVKIVEPDAPDVPLPDKGKWSHSGCLYDELGRWNVAWRLHDAQFWGVPQRRKRIALVADFGGLAAPEVLFERKGLSRDSEPSGAEGEGTSGTAKRSAGDASVYGICSYESNAMKSSNPHSGVYKTDTSRTLDLNGGNPACNQGGVVVVEAVTAGFKAGQSKDGGLGYEEEKAPTLSASPSALEPTVLSAGFSFGQSAKARSIGFQEEVSPTLRGGEGGNQKPCVFDARGNGDGEIAPTMTGDHQNRVTDYTALCVGNGQLNQMSMSEQANTLDTMHDQQAVMIAASLSARDYKGPCAQDLGNNMANYPIQNSFIRRLTPLECERLQGYPDGWTDIGEWTDSKGRLHKEADSPRYKALGNSIALPFWEYLARRICALYERPATMGSLFDGIGGFPLAFERAGAKAVWASEIEEFPIAVTKLHFPEERSIE